MEVASLDFRFADDDDCDDILAMVNSSYDAECEVGDLQFRKPGMIKIDISEIQSDFKNMTTKWLVLETAVPEEDIVGAARFQLLYSSKVGHVDILCAFAYSETARIAVLKKLLAKIEHVGFNHGLNRIIIENAQWRVDNELILTECGYVESSGHIYPENKAHELLKPTMIFEFHKDLHQPVPNVQTTITATAQSAADDASDLLSAVQSISLSPDSALNSGVVYSEEDGGLTIDFETFKNEESNNNRNTHNNNSSNSGIEGSMESIMSDLFAALHKTYN